MVGGLAATHHRTLEACMQLEKTETTNSLDATLDMVVNDVSEPSPIADRGAEEPVAPVADTVSYEQNTSRGGRPRKPDHLLKTKRRERKQSAKREPLHGIENAPQGVSDEPARVESKKELSDDDKKQAAIEASANVAVFFVNGSGEFLAGNEGTMTEREIAQAQVGFEKYFTIKGIDSVPPWIILAGALTPYYMRVLSKQPARNKIVEIFSDTKYLVKKLFGKLRNARSNRRNDAKREDNDSETAN